MLSVPSKEIDYVDIPDFREMYSRNPLKITQVSVFSK